MLTCAMLWVYLFKTFERGAEVGLEDGLCGWLASWNFTPKFS